MKKRQTLARMISAERRRATAEIGFASESEGERGVASLTLDATVGDFPPLSMNVVGAGMPSNASLDAPIALPLAGEHSVDRIGRGFFSVTAENERELLYDTEGLPSDAGATVTIALGSPFDGSVRIEIAGQSFSREISGDVGDSFDCPIPRDAAACGSLVFSASEDGVFRLSLHGENEAGQGLAITLLCHDGDGNHLTSTRILLPTPLLPSLETSNNALNPKQRWIRVGVGHAELSWQSEVSLNTDSSSADPVPFLVSPGVGAWKNGGLMTSFGAVSEMDPYVLSGQREGLSLLSDDRSRFGMALSFARLTQGVLSLEAELRGNASSGTPTLPASFHFFPSGPSDYCFRDRDGAYYRITAQHSLRRVDSYADRLYVNGSARVALCATRIGELVLTGDERVEFSVGQDCCKATILFSGGQMTSPSLDVPQLCTHAQTSSQLAIVSPESVETMAVYLDGSGLQVALKRGTSYGESKSAFSSFLRSCYVSGRPVCVYYPLAEVRWERVAILPDSSGGSDGTMLYPKVVYSKESETLLALVRLWLAGQSPRSWVLYPLKNQVQYTLGELTGELRLPDGGTALCTVGEVKPQTLSLSAYVYRSETTSTHRAAGSENSQAPQKGTE